MRTYLRIVYSALILSGENFNLRFYKHIILKLFNCHRNIQTKRFNNTKKRGFFNLFFKCFILHNINRIGKKREIEIKTGQNISELKKNIYI